MGDGLTGARRFHIFLLTQIWCFIRGHDWVENSRLDDRPYDPRLGFVYIPTGTETCENCKRTRVLKCYFCKKPRGQSRWVCNGYKACKQCGPIHEKYFGNSQEIDVQKPCDITKSSESSRN